MKNNLFTFATSELSQDAFICWCLNWINYPNEELYPMAKDIFSNLLEEKDLENERIEILRQYKKIDVLVILKNSKKDELERISSLGRRKIKDSTKEKDSFLSLFERTKSKYRGN